MDNATVRKRWQIKVKSPLPAGMKLMDIYSEAEKGDVVQGLDCD
ncbi:MAG TPA: hypothetical protein VFH08_13965 [Chitinophagaceae bacterium]|nr:hypothetical protein [Chitinophagaceae bacterium]